MKTALLSLFGAGAALASSPLPRNLEADDFFNLFLQFSPVVFDLNGNSCELSSVGQLEFTQEGSDAVLIGTGASLNCGPQLNLQGFDFGLNLTFASDDFNIPSSVTFDVDFCTANFASNIEGIPAAQEAGIAAGVCIGLNAALIPDLDALIADLAATVGERPTLVPLVQSELPGNVVLPSGFNVLNIPNEGLALLEYFTVTLGESVPVVNLTQEAIADFREVQSAENPNFIDFLPPLQQLIRLVSGDETFILDEVVAGPILASAEFQALINPEIEVDAQLVIALLDVVFAQPAFADLLPVDYADVRDQVAQVITIVFGFLVEDSGFEETEFGRLLQTENLLQLTFQQVFTLFVEGFHVVFSFLDGFTLADAAAFLQEQGISTGNGNEIGAIFQLVPLNTPLSDVPTVLGQVSVGAYAALQVPGSAGDILFSPFLQTPFFGFSLANNMDEAVQFILSLGFTVVNDALGGISIDTEFGFPATYSGAFVYLSIATQIAGADPLISDVLLGLEFAGPAVLLDFLTFEDPLVALSVNATRVRIDAPLDISLVTEAAEIFVGLGTLAPLFVGSNVEVIVAFDITALNGTFIDSGEVVGNYNIAEIPGFTVVSNIQPIFDYNFEDVTTWPDAFTVLPFFATCTVGSFGVAHVGHSSVVTMETTLTGFNSGFFSLIDGPFADAVNGIAAIYSNLLGTVVDQAAVETIFQPVFFVDVGTSCTDDPFFVEENDDDAGLLGDIPTEALIGAGVVVVALLLLVIFFVSSSGSGKYDDDEDEEPAAAEAEAKMASVAEEAEKKEAMEDKL